MRIITCIVIVTALCYAAAANAQDGYKTAKTLSAKLKKSYDNALLFNRQEQFDKALRELDRVLSAEPRFIDGLILRASIHHERGRHAEAMEGYQAALRLDAAYEPRVWYQLGLAAWDSDDFDAAAEDLEKFLATKPRNVALRERAEGHYANARFAAQAVKHPVPFEPRNLGPNINTPGSEYLPSLTADEQFLIFTRVVEGQEDFYISEKVNGQWQPAQPLDDINTPLNEGAQSISADGKKLVFTACNRRDGLGSCDLYFSEWRDGRWTPPANMGAPVNTSAWESQPSLSADGHTLYFASNRPGGLGGNDIWVTRRQADGKWSVPRNLGAPLNTKEHDEAPFIHPDGRTLYFMSKGHPGMGGYDLYYSRYDAEGEWTEPVNLGYPINTKANEGALVVSLDGRTAYFASDRLGDNLSAAARRSTDIYAFHLHQAARPSPVTYVKAIVRDAESGDNLRAQVEFFDLAKSQSHTLASTGADGAFLVVLPLGADYALNVSKERYLFHSENFALSGQNTLTDPFVLEIALRPLPQTAPREAEEEKPVVLRNVFFATGSAILRPESRLELDRLKQLLLDNPTLRIQINGHTDNVGAEQDNQILSENRAKAVYEYLLGAGIADERLRYKGYGKNRPIDSNDTEEGRQRNRRTEFVVIP
jgi:outer membrane protein OmpA-like peptidoglycan-associated protein/Tol biopolymer transport system component